jgi:hypothetical protein
LNNTTARDARHPKRMKQEKNRRASLKLIIRPDGSTVTFHDDRGCVFVFVTTASGEIWRQSLNSYFEGSKPRLRLVGPEEFGRPINPLEENNEQS